MKKHFKHLLLVVIKTAIAILKTAINKLID